MTSSARPHLAVIPLDTLPVPAPSSSHVISNASRIRHHDGPRPGPIPDDDDENAQTTVSANHTRCTTTQLYART